MNYLSNKKTFINIGTVVPEIIESKLLKDYSYNHFMKSCQAFSVNKVATILYLHGHIKVWGLHVLSDGILNLYRQLSLKLLR